MSVLKTRNRLINFRLTEDEFNSLHQACARQSARSVSDFARAAVMSQVEQPAAVPDLAEAAGTIAASAVRLEDAIHGLDTRIGQLVTILQSPQLPQSQ